MPEQKQQRKTALAELVETHNLVKSINRLKGPPYCEERWQRALVHALMMADVGNNTVRKIREALELP